MVVSSANIYTDPDTTDVDKSFVNTEKSVGPKTDPCGMPHDMECSALGSSYVRWKPRNEQLAQMGSFHQSKRSDNKLYAVEVRWGIFFENLTYFFIPWSGRKYFHTNSFNSAITVIAQDDHLTAGAWAACGNKSRKVRKFVYARILPCFPMSSTLYCYVSAKNYEIKRHLSWTVMKEFVNVYER